MLQTGRPAHAPLNNTPAAACLSTTAGLTTHGNCSHPAAACCCPAAAAAAACKCCWTAPGGAGGCRMPGSSSCTFSWDASKPCCCTSPAVMACTASNTDTGAHWKCWGTACHRRATQGTQVRQPSLAEQAGCRYGWAAPANSRAAHRARLHATEKSHSCKPSTTLTTPSPAQWSQCWRPPGTAGGSCASAPRSLLRGAAAPQFWCSRQPADPPRAACAAPASEHTVSGKEWDSSLQLEV